MSQTPSIGNGAQAHILNAGTGNRLRHLRACFRSGEIRILDSTDNVERTIAFSEGEERWRKISFDTRLLNHTFTMRQVR